MNFIATAMALLALLGAVIPVVHLYENRDKPGATWLLAICVVLAVYPLDALLHLGELGVRHRFATIGLIAPLYLLAMMSYLRVCPSAYRLVRAALMGYMPLVLIAPWLSGDWFLSFPTIQPDEASNLYVYSLESGAWTMKVISYLLIVVAAILVLQRLSASRNSRSFLLALALLPLSAGIADLAASLTGYSPYRGVTSVQLATTVGLFALSYVLFRKRLLERAPVSRNLLMSHLREGICVVSQSGEVVDCNGALGFILGISTKKLIGRPANHVLPEPLLQQLDAHLQGCSVSAVEVHIENTERSVSVSVTSLEEGEASASVLMSVADLTEKNNELASVSAVADELQLENEQLLQLSNTDPLTGLGNRRRLIDAMVRTDVNDSDQSLGLIMVDIDHFKTINDTHGHAAGDAVLVRLAQTMLETCRENDLIVRWGGEEFLVLVHNSDEQRLQLAAERLRLQIRRLVIELDNGIALQVTASIGATLLRPGQSPESALRQVDRLLLEAKKEGRDRVKSPR